jgi:hypothetical protein
MVGGKFAWRTAWHTKSTEGRSRTGCRLITYAGIRPVFGQITFEAASHAENMSRGRGTKLTPTEVGEIRRSPEKQKVLSDRYGVSQSLISRIKAGLVWRDVPDPKMPADADPLRLLSLAGALEEADDRAQPDPSISRLLP